MHSQTIFFMGETLMLKNPALSSKPLRATSLLNGRASMDAGQADGLYTQAYQADLPKNRDDGKASPLKRSLSCAEPQIWLSGPPSKQLHAGGQSMAAMVANERHLWVNG